VAEPMGFGQPNHPPKRLFVATLHNFLNMSKQVQKTFVLLRIARYVLERFQFWLFLPFILLSNLILAELLLESWIAILVVSMVNVWQYFTLRVFDEYKDLEIDNELHPNRPIQRGLLSIRELAVFSAGWLVLCLVGFWLIQPNWLWALLAVGSFLLVMLVSANNYFVPGLRQNFLLYNLLHSTSSPVIFLTTYLLWFAFTGWVLDLSLLVSHFLLVLGGTVLLDLVRSAEERHPDSYLTHMSKWQFWGWLLATQVCWALSFGLVFGLNCWWVWIICVFNSFGCFAWCIAKERFNLLKLVSLVSYLSVLVIYWQCL
jgi:4-hydroxybenzoate polyprenyltransferase